MAALTQNLQRIAAEFRAAPKSPEATHNLGADIAEALEWTTGFASIRSVQLASPVGQVTRGLIGPQPAALFVGGTVSHNGSLLNQAALYAYHASIEWGLIANEDGAQVFNSRWVRRNEWFHLPLIHWSEVDKNRDIFEAITPEGVTHGEIERLATRVQKPDGVLQSVDDALVDRLDYWRTQALRYAQSINGLDDKLQTLFAQLFILRVVEDRRLAPELPPLRSVSSISGKIDLAQLLGLLKSASEVIGSDIFETNTVQDIPEQVLSGIITDLYIPHNLPYAAARYNFEWIDADILGLAYEKYLSTVLTPLPPSPQLSFLETPEREVERVSVRKSSAVYYTPKYLVRFLTESAFEQLGDAIEPGQIPRIADFACGSGSFLVAATDSLLHRLRQRDPTRNWVQEIVDGKHIIGIDIDERAVTMTRLALWTRFAEEPSPLPLPRLGEIIVQGDSLGRDVWSDIPGDYDIVLGNPPFLAVGHTPSREELAARFKTAQGRYDYSYLFVELAVNHLNPSGVLAMVVPNRLFINQDANSIREILTSDTDLFTILDFGSNQVFVKTLAYIGAIEARKVDPQRISEAKFVRVIKVIDISPEHLAAHLMTARISGDAVSTEVLTAYDAPHPRGSSPWVLASPSARHARFQLENDSEPLSAHAEIFQGIKTGANDVFIAQLQSSEGSFATIVNGLGDSSLIETALLHPVVFGSDIRKYEVVSSNRVIIYPYRHGAVIPEAELRESFPLTFEYLTSYRNLLADRGSIVAGSLRWYELVRKRDEVKLGSPKLIIRDLATETSFAIDRAGDTYLVGGTAVVTADRDMLLPLLAYLNSAIVTEYLSLMTPRFQGGFQKFEPQHLSKIPVPNALLRNPEDTQLLAAYAEGIINAVSANNEEARRSIEGLIEQLIEGAIASTDQEIQ